MTGLVIVAHGDLAQSLYRTAASIVGEQGKVLVLGIDHRESLESIDLRLGGMIETLRQNCDGVLIMTDMFGGTPTNVSIPFLSPGKIEILAGVSLPMVLKYFSYREKVTLPELVTMLKNYAQQGVVLVSETFAE